MGDDLSMGSPKVSLALAKTNHYFRLAPEPPLHALTAFMQLIKLERSQSNASIHELPHGFIFPLDSVVALCGGIKTEGVTTLIRFAGNNEFFRVDALTDTTMSRVIRSGYAILIDKDVWMKFGAQFPPFLETMAEFVHGRKSLVIVNAACYSSHRHSKRLARLLLEARAAYPATEEWLALSQLDLATLITARRETVTRMLAELSTAGAIETARGKIRILDPQVLRQRSCGCIDRAQAIADHQIELAKGLFKRIAPRATPNDLPLPRRLKPAKSDQ